MKIIHHVIITCLFLTLGLTSFSAHAASEHSAGKWDDKTLAQFGELPILDGGRIKPMSTFAQFAMLRINGKRSYIPVDSAGEELGRDAKMGPMEWFLDCLFYPEIAREYKVFIIDNTDVATAIGIELKSDDQRARFSYNELEGARAELFGRAQAASKLSNTERSYQESAILALAEAVYEFESFIHYFDFAHTVLDAGESRLIVKILGEGVDGKKQYTLPEILANSIELQTGIAALGQIIESEGQEKYMAEVTAMESMAQMLNLAEVTAFALRIIPPVDADNDEWTTPSELSAAFFKGTEYPQEELDVLSQIVALGTSVENDLLFKQKLDTLHGTLVGRATERNEYTQIPLEIKLYDSKILARTQVFFILSFILCAISWLSLKSKWLNRASIVSVIVPLGMLIVAITMRCIIRGRPPISTLYETVLFITATCVLVALFMEYINRQRIGLSVGAFLGALGMFIANRYEIINQQDTMPSLVAVLDTNFWLATHVTIINIGYAATMLAAGISHVYILGRLFNFKKDNPAYYRSITRMVYGVTCFGLIFAFVGTVLGGIWANYSWGRFWGWDPKENGAALICICQIALLHAKAGGYIKQMGIHIVALFTAGVTGFSWWGVNLLGVGLHSYGFTEGIWTATYLFWAVLGVVALLGFIVYLRDRKKPSTPTEDLSDAGAPAIAK